jgi:hypothetical protein
MEQAVRTRNYRKFYALLAQMPGANKEDLVTQFTGSRTDSLEEMKDTEYYLMLVAMEHSIASVKGRYAEHNLWRKRVMAAIGAWLRGRNMPETADRIKAIACRAAKADSFNDIPLSKLRALYEEWRRKEKVSVEANAVIAELDRELTLMN